MYTFRFDLMGTNCLLRFSANGLYMSWPATLMTSECRHKDAQNLRLYGEEDFYDWKLPRLWIGGGSSGSSRSEAVAEKLSGGTIGGTTAPHLAPLSSPSETQPTRTNDVKAAFLRPRCHDSYDTRVLLIRDQQRVDVQKLLCADKDKIKLKSISDRAAIDVRPGPTWRSQDSASLLISQGWHQGQTIDNCRQDKTRPAAFLRV